MTRQPLAVALLGHIVLSLLSLIRFSLKRGPEFHGVTLELFARAEPDHNYSQLFVDALGRWWRRRFIAKPSPPDSGTRALFLLVRHVSSVRRFLRNNQPLFAGRFFDEFYVFQEERLTGTVIIENVTLRFVDVTRLWETFPDGFDPKRHNSTWRGYRSSRDPLWGYQQMCRFFWMTVFDIPELSGVRFGMRLDDDSCLRQINSSPFTLLKDSVVYVFSSFGVDSPHVVMGLRELAEDYVRYFRLVPKNPALWKSAFQGKKVRMFWTNLEVLDLKFWRRTEVQQFVTFVDAAWGIFISRWGDAPLRYIAMALFAKPEQVVKMPEGWQYKHWC